MPRLWSLFADWSQLPEPWATSSTTPLADGSAIETAVRNVAVDHAEMAFTRDVRCRLVRGGRTLRTEVHRLVARFYNPYEVLGILRDVGFVDAAFEERPLWDGGPFHVFQARRSG